MPTKTFFSAYYFLKLHLHHFSKIKSHKEVIKHNIRNKGFSYFFCFMIEGSGSVAVSLTNGSGSRRPKTSGSGSATLEPIVKLFYDIVHFNNFHLYIK
jgi:hypothetical protein